MQTRSILWYWLFASTFAYLGIYFVVAKPHAPGGPGDAAFVISLSVVACSIAAMSFVIPRLVLKSALARLAFATADDTRMGSLEALRVFTNPEDVRTRAQGALQTSFILRMALREAIAIFGLVLGFIGHPLVAVLPFFVASWALMALAYPSARADDAEIERATGATFA